MSDVEKLIDMLDDSACRCHEAYISRRMTDPNCNHDDAELWRELRAGVSELRRQLAEAEDKLSDANESWDLCKQLQLNAEAKLALAEQDSKRLGRGSDG